MEGLIFNVQPFSVHDGPGIRTTVFMMGCSLRCWWCHNPESQSRTPVVMRHEHKCIACGACVEACPRAEDGRTALHTARCTACGACAEACYAEALEVKGRRVESGALYESLRKDARIGQNTGGGVTFSGGEPLLQAAFVGEVLARLKADGVHTALETALHAPWASVEALLPLCDLWLCDLKHIDPERHREGTGADNALILENMRKIAASGAALRVRTPVIPGYNDSEEHAAAVARFLKTLPRLPQYELLPFHGLCEGKYRSLNRAFRGQGLAEPTEDALLRLSAAYARVAGVETVNQSKRSKK